jgi:hypothetical protein
MKLLMMFPTGGAPGSFTRHPQVPDSVGHGLVNPAVLWARQQGVAAHQVDGGAVNGTSPCVFGHGPAAGSVGVVGTGAAATGRDGVNEGFKQHLHFRIAYIVSHLRP